MTTHTHLRGLLAIPFVFTAVSCADDLGTAPLIENLSYDTDPLPLGSQGIVTGQFVFADPDGDVLELAIGLSLPDGSSQSLPPTPIEGNAGRTEGTIAVTLALVPPLAGEYGFSVSVTDDAGNESNQLMGTIRAE